MSEHNFEHQIGTFLDGDPKHIKKISMIITGKDFILKIRIIKKNYVITGSFKDEKLSLKVKEFVHVISSFKYLDSKRKNNIILTVKSYLEQINIKSIGELV